MQRIFFTFAMMVILMIGASAQTTPEHKNRDFDSELFEPNFRNVLMDVKDGIIEEACLYEIEARIRPKLVSGEIADYPTEQTIRARRTCTLMSLCDTVNGVPDYFHRLASTSSNRSPYPKFCSGVSSFGAELIENEPAIFDPAKAARDMMREAYQEGAEKADAVADTAINNSDAFLDLGAIISPFTLD